MIVGVCADRRSSLPRTACNLDIEGRCAALSFSQSYFRGHYE
jgi:hypothetical protein